jgi:hypothetical protein
VFLVFVVEITHAGLDDRGVAVSVEPASWSGRDSHPLASRDEVSKKTSGRPTDPELHVSRAAERERALAPRWCSVLRPLRASAPGAFALPLPARPPPSSSGGLRGGQGSRGTRDARPEPHGRPCPAGERPKAGRLLRWVAAHHHPPPARRCWLV